MSFRTGSYDDEFYDSDGEEFVDTDYDSEESYSGQDSRYSEYDEEYDEYSPRDREENRARRRSEERTSRRRTESNKNTGKRKKKKRKHRRNSPVFMIVILIVILGVAFGAKLYLDRYSYSNETADLDEEFGITSENDVAIIWGDELSEVRAKLIDGVYYMTLDDVKNNLNDRFYYGVQNAEDETGMILYCLPDEMISVEVGSYELTSEESGTTELSYIPVLNEEGTIYLALDFVQDYTAFSMTAFTQPNRLQINTHWDEETVATVKKNTQVRTSGGIKSPILEEVEKGEQVVVLEEMETWSKVKTADSIIGYIENKKLTDYTTQTPSAGDLYEEPEVSYIEFDGKINMAFHNVWGSQGNDTLTSYLEQTQDVNIVAPTWYWVSDDSGNMDKAATQEYVDTAHSLGCQVWAVVDNINSSTLEDNHTFLTTLDSRTNLIDQLIAEAQTYGFEGINVDFELIPEENGEDYIEFIRELSIACRKEGIILSVDNYPAYEYNSHYDLEEQGVFADYIVIMGYDEHYAGDDEAGSVASISYVTEGIQMALEVVSADRVINAVPFYSRIWTTENGTITSEAYGMQDIENYITEHGMTKTWSSETGQYYAEMTQGDALIQIWVEDAQSIQLKLEVMEDYEIKGVAEWRLQFETADVWDVIAEYMAQ